MPAAHWAASTVMPKVTRSIATVLIVDDRSRVGGPRPVMGGRVPSTVGSTVVVLVVEVVVVVVEVIVEMITGAGSS